MKGSLHGLDSGAFERAVITKLPDSRVKLFDEQFVLESPDGKVLPGLAYHVIGVKDEDLSATSDEGKTQRVGGEAEETLKFALRAYQLAK